MKSKEQKRTEAEARNAAYSALTLAQKRDLLATYVAKRQRARLDAQTKKGAK